MGYMAGDYYAGDYYAGGILSGLGSILKGGIKTGLGFLKGGPVGAGVALVSHAITEHHDNAAPAGPSNLPAIAPRTHSGAIDTFLRGGGHFSAAGRAKLTAEHDAALQPKMIAPPHLAHLLGRRRRMNWANGKALGRAERRIHSAVKHMSKYIRWVHPTKPGHAVPKFGRRAKKR
jgi:hypothetical protein